MTDAPSPAPGWYPDPRGGPEFMWWDGEAWQPDIRRGGVPMEFDLSPKSRVVAGVLGILLGGLGVHSFYLGKTKIGIAQIAVTIVTCGVGSLWGFVEGILILVGSPSYSTDAEGRPLRD